MRISFANNNFLDIQINGRLLSVLFAKRKQTSVTRISTNKFDCIQLQSLIKEPSRMETVDYLKLSEQYAGFLVAIGGVSITVLALVLSFGSDTNTPDRINSRSFLVVALVVATITCFIGAHMMAETAAYIQFYKDLHQTTGARLFLLASTNIFTATILVLFALVLIPASSGRVHAPSLAPILTAVFLIIAGVILFWLILAVNYRLRVAGSDGIIWICLDLGGIWLWVLLCLPSKLLRSFKEISALKWVKERCGHCSLWLTFTPSLLSTAVSLICFAWVFSEGDPDQLREITHLDIWLFSLAIAVSYASLIAGGIKKIKRPVVNNLPQS